jgi:SAM-dependent methyltransferase
LRRIFIQVQTKVWNRITGIEPRRLWQELIKTQQELIKTQQELIKTQQELTINQQELTINQQELTINQQELIKTQSRVKMLCNEMIRNLNFPLNEVSKELIDVSVIIPTKNRIQFLLRALNSVKSASKNPNQIVIVNNGRKFTSIEEMEIRRACPSTSKILLVDGQEFQDVSTCRDTALRLSISEYITYLDDDNIMWPTWLESAFNYLDEGKLNFVYGIQLREDMEARYFLEEFSDIQIKQGNFVDTNSIMHRRGTGRWSPGVTRLSDWCFILNYYSDNPGSPMVPIQSISGIYKTDAPNRISSSLYSPYHLLIGLLHDLIPSSAQLIEQSINYCVICKNSTKFTQGPNGREGATCPICGSLERHRAFFLINEVISAHIINEGVQGKIIEVAPSNVSKAIFSIFGSNYENFDLNPSADGRECDFIADICNIPLPNNSVSEFVALHVLEHVPNDQLAFKEISRVLAPAGVCILQVPLAEYPEITQEEVIEDDSVRIEKYGQVDHVRLYGEDILQRMQTNGLDAHFISIEEILPDFLLRILGLRDGAKFILSKSNDTNQSEGDIPKLLFSLRENFSRLEIFCRLLER